MRTIPQDEIDQVRSLDLLTYLENYDPNELVARRGGHFSTKSHDSVDISNGKWYRWATGQGGVSALDYLVKVEEVPFVEAVTRISDLMNGRTPVLSSHREFKEPKKELVLPERNENNNIVIEYLRDRGIDRKIIDILIENGYVYENQKYHSVMFVGYDNFGTPRYASYRATDESGQRGDIKGSEKRYSFRWLSNQSGEMHVFESPIDAMSYMTLIKEDGGDWMNGNYISLSGLSVPKNGGLPVAMEDEIRKKEWDKIYIHFDNDEAGRNAAGQLYLNLLANNVNAEIITDIPEYGKDVNEYLCMSAEEDHVVNLDEER